MAVVMVEHGRSHVRGRGHGRGSTVRRIEVIHTASTSRRGGNVILAEDLPRDDEREEEEEEEDFYQRQARLNPIDNRTGRRTRRRSGPGSPTPESRRQVDLDALLSVPNNYSGIPAFPPIVAYAVNPNGTFDPEDVQIMVERNSAGFATRMQREVLSMKDEPDTPISYVTGYLREQLVLGNNARFYRSSLGASYQIEAVQKAEANILESITCSICFDACVGRIFQCPNKHVVCQNCQDNLWREAGRAGGVCPTCRAPGVPRIRALIKEDLARKINVHCGYHHLGCTVQGSIQFIKHHKKEECRYRSVVCYFCDARVNMNKAVRHISVHHSDAFEDCWTFDSIESSFKITKLPLKGDDCGLAFIKITIAGEGVFVLTQVEVQIRKFMYFIFKVDTMVNSRPYKMTGVIKYCFPEHPTLMRKQKWTANAVGGHCKLGKVFESLDDSFKKGDEEMCTLDLTKFKHPYPEIKFFVKLSKESPLYSRFPAKGRKAKSL